MLEPHLCLKGQGRTEQNRAGQGGVGQGEAGPDWAGLGGAWQIQLKVPAKI